MDRKPLRLTWSLSELPSPLSPAARQRLIADNAGFDAESRWAELERLLAIEVRTRALSAPARERRRGLDDFVTGLEQVERALALPRTRGDVLAALAAVHAPAAVPRPLPFARFVKAYREAALDALKHDVPATGGRPSRASRDRVAAITCAWVESLPPLRARKAARIAIRRNAERDTHHLPLRAPDDALTRRCVESVKTILGDLRLPASADLTL